MTLQGYIQQIQEWKILQMIHVLQKVTARTQTISQSYICRTMLREEEIYPSRTKSKLAYLLL